MVLPDVEDVLDDDAECSQRTEGHADVCDHGVRNHAGNEETTSGASDADAEIAEGVVEVVHGERNIRGRITCQPIRCFPLQIL